VKSRIRECVLVETKDRSKEFSDQQKYHYEALLECVHWRFRYYLGEGWAVIATFVSVSFSEITQEVVDDYSWNFWKRWNKSDKFSAFIWIQI